MTGPGSDNESAAVRDPKELRRFLGHSLRAQFARQGIASAIAMSVVMTLRYSGAREWLGIEVTIAAAAATYFSISRFLSYRTHEPERPLAQHLGMSVLHGVLGAVLFYVLFTQF